MSVDLTRFYKNKPLHIGVCGGAGQSASIAHTMDNIRAMGAVPYLMINHGQYSCNESILSDVQRDIAGIDALVIMGNNGDIDPASYGQVALPTTLVETEQPGGKDRQYYEGAIIEAARKHRMPVLAICGGMQRVNVALGGSLHQHIPDLLEGRMHHQQPAAVHSGKQLADFEPIVNGDYHISPLSMIGQRLDQHSVQDVCAHHQAVDRIGAGLRTSIVHATDSYADGDGGRRALIEGLETDPSGPLADWPVLGFQFHPEFKRSPVGNAMMGWLGEEAAKYHARHPTPHARASLAVPSEPGNQVSP